MSFPIRTVICYLALAGIWIVFSDKLLASLLENPEALTGWQSVKGLAFILLNGALVYWLARRSASPVMAGDASAAPSEPRIRLATAAVFLVSLLVGAGIVAQVEEKRIQQRKAIALSHAFDHGQALRAHIDRALSATYALAAAVRQGQGRIDSFAALAEGMLPLYPGVSSVTLAPAGVISDVIPRAGNERALGIDIVNSPILRAGALEAIRSRRVVLDGPLQLGNGKTGLIGRLAVFLDDGEQAKFWGFVSAAVELDEMLHLAHIHEMHEHEFELTQIGRDGASVPLAKASRHGLQDPVTQDIEVLNGRWRLSLSPTGGWGAPSTVVAEGMLVVLVSGLLAFVMRALLRQPMLLRRQVELRTRELAAANRRLTTLHQAIEQSPATVIITDREGRIEYANPRFSAQTGYALEEAVGRTPHLLNSGVNDESTFKTLWQRILAGHEWRGELCNRRKNGELFWEEVVIAPVKADGGEITHFIAVNEDVSERREAREALKRLNRTLRVISQGNAALVRAGDEPTLLREIGRILVDLGGYCSVWVGMPDERNAALLRPAMMVPGKTVDLTALAFDRGPQPAWPGFIGAALAEGRPVVSTRVEEDPFSRVNEAETGNCGCRAGAALPLVSAGETFGILVLRAADETMLGVDEIALLQELADDLAYGIAALRARVAGRLAQAKLADSEEIFRAISSAAQDAIILVDPKDRIRYWNPGAERMFGYGEEEAIGVELHRLVASADRLGAVSEELDVFAASGITRTSGALLQMEARRRDGRRFPIELSISTIRIREEWHAVGVVRDISARRQAEDALRLRDQALEAASNGIMISAANEADHPLTYVNPAFERITGFSAGEVVGRNGRFLLGPEIDQIEVEQIRLALREGRDGRAVLRNYRKDGSLFWNELSVSPVRDREGRITHFVSVMNDITEHKRYEAQLEYQANHDELTGLPNRNLLADRLDQALVHAARDGLEVAVMVVDLDHFKFINDSLGHVMGDGLLRSVSARLQTCVRDCDTVARLGADGFVLVLPADDATQVAQSVRERIQSALEQAFELDGKPITVTCSIGISLFPRDATEPQALIKHADAAMYRVKEQGRNGFQFFTAEINARVHERLTMERQLRRALENDELLLHFQPQVDLGRGTVVGSEALVRWMHPELGMVPPLRFIPLAEETGLIVPLGEWVLWAAARQNKAWLDAGLAAGRVGVNLSARQFADADLLALIRRVLDETGLLPAQLDLELTESMAMQAVDQGARLLREFKQLGVRTSLDDFGTGHSSLSYLRQFSVDTLKIDRSFVRDIDKDPHNAAIATTIIAMAHNLGLQVIAEGVETQAELDYLRAHACDEIQGYFFSKPLSAADYEALLRSGRRLTA